MKGNKINNSFVIVENIVKILLFACYCVIGLISECIGSPFRPHFHEKDGNKKLKKKFD